MTRSPRGALTLGLAAGALGLSIAAPASAACANETLRTELGSGSLPDCRAYEQVTPPYKEGFELLPVSYSQSGETAVLETYGAIAGTQGASEEGLTAYLAHRTSTGWRTEPLEPSGSTYPGQAIRTANADSGASLWQLHSREQSPLEVSLYARSAVGSWTAIGPLFSPAEAGGEPSSTTSPGLSASIAATADYSHVVFSTPKSELDGAGHAMRWPFDATVGPSTSLYEYSGVENHAPMLVDVRGAKGSTELLSRCGAVLGSGDVFQGSTFNALSADGETIFFTPLPEDVGNGQCVAPEPNEPAVAEVYARVGGAATSSRPAETVDVSARSALSCGAVCAGSQAADKLFEGASEDGSKVVFASTQALIDGASEDATAGDGAVAGERGSGCAETSGPGGCNLYVYDVARRALALIAGGAEVLGVTRLSADGSHVYFVAKGALGQPVNAGGDRVQTAPTAGRPNLYVYDTVTRTTSFVATLDPEANSELWRTTDQRPVQASAGEGRFLLFASRGVRLTRDDHAMQTQLFEYDSLTGALVRVSKGEVVAGEAGAVERGEKSELGYEENGNAVSGTVDGEALGEGETFHGEDFHQLNGGTGIYLAPDGSSVAFASAGRLSSAATSAERGCLSMYEFRTSVPGDLSSGHVALISDGRDVQPFRGQACLGAQPLAMSPDGTDILFSTADPLAPNDTDGLQRDIYDARIEGGFALARGADACAGEACRGPLTASLEAQVPATALQLPGGNAGVVPVLRATVRIMGYHLSGHTLTVVVRTNAPGRVILSGRGLRSAGRGVTAGVRTTVKARFTSAAAKSMRGRKATRVKLTLVFRSRAGSKATARLAVTPRS